MAGQDLVRPSRDGDQFHYHWAARQCLGLLPGGRDLVAVTVEGSSANEAEGDEIEAGEQLIDVGLYYGSENRDNARLVRYIQLKHSTRRALEAWTASGLAKTIRGFAERYAKLIERFPSDDVSQRYRFEFTTNRPIDTKLKEALADFASGAPARHPDLYRSLITLSTLNEAQATGFFRLFSAEGNEEDFWAQRNLLTQDVSAYLPDADYDAPIQLKELVTRKATTEFQSNPSIRRHDVLRALKTSEELLRPAPNLIADTTHTLSRQQEQEILQMIITAEKPVVIHADGGVGKSVLAARLAASLQSRNTEAVLYDCFGDGLYRNALHFRHRHRDALVQITNELAALGLCHPLIPTAHADVTQYMRAFIHRLIQASTMLRSKSPEALLCLIIDAADNAEMVAEEQGESASFVRDLIRAPLPEGVRLVLTCRTHRRHRLRAPPGTPEIELSPFSESESASHLRSVYPLANETDVAEFAFLSSSNPRVQALALSRGVTLHEMLQQLGPRPTTVDRAIGELLEKAVAKLRDQVGAAEASQIDVICQGLAVLRPLVPISILAQLSGTSESTVRSFALDIGRPLLVRGDSLHFLDEPAETWFRERFHADAPALATFLDRLRPLTTQSSYAAATLPQILLQAGKLDELVGLALSEEELPVENPLVRRDVELQRLTFALKACLQQGRYMAAAKLAMKAGGECAGEQRQNNLIQNNTDLAAALMAPDRIEEIVSRRTFGSGWMGSRHAYDAGLLSGREELSAEASSRLRMAMDWLRNWARLSKDKRQGEEVSDADRGELAIAQLRLRGPEDAVRFLRSWRPRRHAFEAGRHLGKRLADLGQFEQFDSMAEAAGNDIWLLLGMATEARAVGHLLPATSLARLLRLLADHRVKLPESQAWNENWILLYAITSAVELALRVLPPEPTAWAGLLRRYLPPAPPSDLTSRFGFDRAPLLRAYALEAALRGQKLALIDVAPPDVRQELEKRHQYARSRETETFLHDTGSLVPLFALAAEITCGRMPPDLTDAIAIAIKSISTAEARSFRQDSSLRQTAVQEWLRILCDPGIAAGTELEEFRSWFTNQKTRFWPNTLISLCRLASRVDGFESLALDFAADCYESLETSREDAESQADSYLRLARAILTVSPSEASVYFDRAIEISSRIGEENLDRWTALLNLAEAAGEHNNPRPQTAYRLSRVAELTYEYVARDKHFDWEHTVKVLTDLCASSCLAILSRWRDRRFGDTGRLLPLAIYRIMEHGRLPTTTPIAFAGLKAEWNRLADLTRVVSEGDATHRAVAAQIAFRYMRVQPNPDKTWTAIDDLSKAYGLDFPDIDRLIAVNHESPPKEHSPSAPVYSGQDGERRAPDWDEIFHNVNLSDTNTLCAAYAKIRTYDPPYEFETFFCEAFKRVPVGREPELVHAIATWPDFGIIELRYLLDALPSFPPKQVALRNAIRSAVLSACRSEPKWVQRRGWGQPVPFEKLDTIGLVSDRDVVRATLEGFTNQVEVLGTRELFRLVHSLAACLSAEEANDSLNYALGLLEEVLQPDDGDGPWHPELQPPQPLISAVAGCIWAGLGSPEVTERWQYAHVVRSMVELGWTEFLEALISWTNTGAAGPFADQGLEFYLWHARQWLLIGLYRGGLSNAAALRPGIPLLQRWLHEEHVLIRELSAQTLRVLVTAGELSSEIAGDLDSVNLPGLPEEVYSGWLDPVQDESSPTEDTETNEEKYYFGIDIGPYWFSPLGAAFGLTEDAIERRARYALRRHMGCNAVGSQEDARYTRNIFKDQETHHSHGSLPKTDDLRSYYGYHAMMLVAADLLKVRPVRRHTGAPENEFQEWLSRYLLTRADGKWLADRRDPRLVADTPPAEGHLDKQWNWSITSNYLDQQLESDDGFITLWGHWSGGETSHNETVSVRSALVSRAGSGALVAALQTAPVLGQFVLPRAEERETLRTGALSLEGWVTDESIPTCLDQGDPWAEGLHYPGPAPSKEIIANLGLVSSTDGRTWAAPQGMLRSETWTRMQGIGREAEIVAGWKLSGTREFVECLLDKYPEKLLVLCVEVKRRLRHYGRDNDEFKADPGPYARYYLMGADGVAHTL